MKKMKKMMKMNLVYLKKKNYYMTITLLIKVKKTKKMKIIILINQ